MDVDPMLEILLRPLCFFLDICVSLYFLSFVIEYEWVQRIIKTIFKIGMG